MQEEVKAPKTPWNPSLSATARVKNPLPVPCACNVCGACNVRIATHEEIYKGRAFGEWPWAYLCPDCGAYVGLHPFTNIPLGTLADKRLRDARNRCKRPFLRLTEEGYMGRKEAYAWLGERMGLAEGTCHWGWFGLEQCYEAEAICKEYLLTA